MDNPDFISVSPESPFKVNQAGPLPTQAFAFERDPKKVQLFMDWLREQIDLGIMEILPGQQIGQAVESAWSNQYIQTAYQKGMYYPRFHGKSALVMNKKGHCYEVLIKDGGKEKMLIVHPIHLKRA